MTLEITQFLASISDTVIIGIGLFLIRINTKIATHDVRISHLETKGQKNV